MQLYELSQKRVNVLSDCIMAKLKISHQRFFTPDSTERRTIYREYSAANVGFFTPYNSSSQKDYFLDITFQFLGVLLKPLIYISAVVGYIIPLVFLVPVGMINDRSLDIKGYTKRYFNEYFLEGIIGILHSSISMVTEPLFTAIGLFTRFFGPLVNPEFTILNSEVSPLHQGVELHQEVEPVHQEVEPQPRQIRADFFTESRINYRNLWTARSPYGQVEMGNQYQIAQ